MNIKDGVNMGKISNETKSAVNFVEESLQRSFSAIIDFKLINSELVDLYNKCETMDNEEFKNKIITIKSLQTKNYSHNANFVNKYMNEAIKDKGLADHKKMFGRKLITQKRLEVIFSTSQYIKDANEDVRNKAISIGVNNSDEKTDIVLNKQVEVLILRKENLKFMANIITALLKIVDYFDIFIEV